MNWKVFSIEVFAVMASYLIITIPLSGAVQVNVFYNGIASGDPIEIGYSGIVDKSVHVKNPGSSATVSVSVENGSADNSIIEAYVYKCKAMGPRVCVSQSTPVKYEGSFEADYAWSDIRDTGTGYPQTANILTLVKFKRIGGESWAGYWDVVTRSGDAAFSVDAKDIDEIEIHAKASQHTYSIRYFVQNLLMIPMNANWISKVVFKTATEIRNLNSEEPPAFTIETLSGSDMTSMDYLYAFSFPKNDLGIMGSATLNLNPDYTCGNGNCESASGEGQSVCCYDCGCPTGYYCDAEMLCKSESAISMSLHGSPDTRVTNCNEDHVIYIPVKVTNLPGDACVKSASYSLAGDVYPVQCGSAGEIFSCPVNVPAVPGCDTGEYNVGPNTLTLTIEYSDGDSTRIKAMSVSFPNVTIGSFECGNDACESGLGEDEANCCLDCGCAAGKYCDWGGPGSVPSDAKCKTPLVNDNLYMESINPSHFYEQPAGGNDAEIVIGIDSTPSSLSVDSIECSMGCSGSNGTCDSSCYLTGCEDISSAGVYMTRCDLNFFITDYNALTDYDLSPVFTADVRYNNGTEGVVTSVLTSEFPTISIGAHWCGDNHCGSDESHLTCCYDCPCPSSYYCDTRVSSYPSSGDGCVLREFQLHVDDVENDIFQDSSVQHYINIKGRVTRHPGGTDVTGECVIQNGEFECVLICEPLFSGDEDEYNFTCQMIVPPIDYVGSPYFNPDTREITLAGNSFSLIHSYNNGPEIVNETHDFSAGEITLNVTSHCGEGGCEGNLGEGQATCCRDCGCSDYGEDYFCYTGQSPNGVCLPNSSIILEITDFTPDPTECIIYKEGEECRIAQSTIVEARILNPPSDVSVIDSYYSAGQQEDTPVDCRKTLKAGYYVCPIALEDVPGATELGTEELPLEVTMIIKYRISNFTITQSISGESGIKIDKVYSDALQSCKDMMANMEKQMSGLEKSKTNTNLWMVVFLVLGAVFLAIFVVTCLRSGGCNYMWLALSVMCFAAAIVMVTVMGGQDDQIAAMETQMKEKMAMCDSLTVEELSGLEQKGLTEIPQVK